MSVWNVNGSVTIPADSVVQIRYIGGVNGGGSASVLASGDFSFNYDDINGANFILIFELFDDFGFPKDIQPVAHGPYDPSIVGTAA